MKTILDISLLGQGFYHQKARTGVFRVVEHYAKLLPEVSPNLEVFYADDIDLTATFGYVQKYLGQQNPRFVNAENQITSAKFQSQILSYYAHNSIVQKSLRRFFYFFKPKSTAFQKKYLSEIELYHSTFYPIPESISVQKKIKKVVTIHDVLPIKYPHFFENRTDNIVQQIIKSIQPDTFVICISEATKSDLLSVCNLPESQIFVVPLAASKTLFYPVLDRNLIIDTLQKYAIPSNRPYFLSIATIEPRKNIHTVIQCFLKLITQQRIDDLQLVLVGVKGWDFDKVFDLIKISPILKGRIIVTGYVPDEDLAPLYSGALGFVYMSYCEGFGLPPLEAMQCGTPVVCSNTTSLPEVVGDAGILISPDDQDTICQSMWNLYQNSTLRESLRIKSVKQSSLFSWDLFTENTWQCYQKIV